jgi:hypothetical protein
MQSRNRTEETYRRGWPHRLGKARPKKYECGGFRIRHGDTVLLQAEKIDPEAESGFDPDRIDEAVLTGLIDRRNTVIDMLRSGNLEGLVLGKAAGAFNFRVRIFIGDSTEPLDAIFYLNELERIKLRL